MPKARDDDLCEYELERIAKINRNLDFLEQLGIEVDRSAYFPKKPSKRKSKVESDSSSDEEWRPGKDENNRRKFKPFKPVFKPMKTGHTITKRNSKISASESKSSHEPQAQSIASQAQPCTIQPTDDCSDFEFLGRLTGDEAIFEDLENVAPETKKRSIKFKCKRVAAKPTRRSSRQNVRKNYTEEEVPDDDHYIYCDQCDDFYYGECPTHNFKIIQDNVMETETKSPDAMKSLPENLSVKHSLIPEAGMGIFAKEKLEVNTRFGPYRGVKVLKEDLGEGRNTSYMWEIVQEGKIQYYIDGKDPCQSNWMRFVNCARCEDEQNIIAYQYHGDIYYRVYKEVEVGAELLVWYGDEYAEQLDIPLFEEDENQERKNFEVGGHTCHHCGRMFTYISYLEKHLKRCPMLVCTKLWECPHCSRKYSSEDYLNVHVNKDCKKNPQGEYEKQKRHSGSAKPLSQQEQISGQTYKDNSAVIHHNNISKDGAFRCKDYDRTYNGVRFFQCQYCEKGFTKQGNLKRHQRIHSGEQPFQCQYCSKTCTQQYHLKSHERTHTGLRPYHCEYCEKSFADKFNLKVHQRTHTGVRPYQCQYCEKTFTHQSHMREHERIHSGERPYQCEHCGKGFAQSSSLLRHQVTHSDERLYQCEHCEKSFKHQRYLKSHEKVHSGERPYKCEHCGKGFIENSDLKVHQRTHTGERPYRCQYCERSFRQQGHLKKHEKTHTG